MQIRRANAGDIPGMLALLKQVGQVHHVIRPDIFRSGALKYDKSDLESLLREENRPVFVATQGDFVAGYCFCVEREYDGTGVSTRRKEIYIDDLCVDEGCRGRGIAKALYAHVCEYAESLGCDAITLNVWCGNEGAQRFYEKMGMTPRNIVMEKKLC